MIDPHAIALLENTCFRERVRRLASEKGRHMARRYVALVLTGHHDQQRPFSIPKISAPALGLFMEQHRDLVNEKLAEIIGKES